MKHEEAIQSFAVEQYLLGEMSPTQREAFEEHYFECEVCASELRTAVSFKEDMRAILAAEQVSPTAVAPVVRDDPKPAWNWLSWLQPQMAAAALAGLAAISIGSVAMLRSEIGRLSEPRVVNSAFLRDQTRGEAPVLRVDGDAAALLSFDLPVATDSKLDFLVQSANGGVVYKTSADAPRSNEQVNFLIPKLNLPAGSYKVLVRDPGKDEDLAQYPFEIQGTN